MYDVNFGSFQVFLQNKCTTFWPVSLSVSESETDWHWHRQ